ncbi:MAG: luciferase family protein [Pseudomonadota bacterium]
MNPLRIKLSSKLRDLSVEERAWPGRDDGFASLLFEDNEFAHFHNWCEIDIRLGKDVIARERLVRQPSRVHPERAKGSPWYEMKFNTASDVNEAVRLVRLAILGLGNAK